MSLEAEALARESEVRSGSEAWLAGTLAEFIARQFARHLHNKLSSYIHHEMGNYLEKTRRVRNVWEVN